MVEQDNTLTRTVKEPSMIFMAMLRRLKFPHNEIKNVGVMIPAWLDDAIKQYYKNKDDDGRTVAYGGIRLDEYLQKMFCGSHGAYGANAGTDDGTTSPPTVQTDGEAPSQGDAGCDAQGMGFHFPACHE